MNDVAPLVSLYKSSQAERKQQLAEYARLTDAELATLAAGLSPEQAEVMIKKLVARPKGSAWRPTTFSIITSACSGESPASKAANSSSVR